MKEQKKAQKKVAKKINPKVLLIIALVVVIGVIVLIVNLTNSAKSKTINIEETARKLLDIKVEGLEFGDIETTLNAIKLDSFAGIANLTRQEIEDLGIDTNLMEDYMIKYNREQQEFLAIIKVSDENREFLDMQLEMFMDTIRFENIDDINITDKDVVVEYVNNYLVGVVSYDSDTIINLIKVADTSAVFKYMNEINITEISTRLRIEQEQVEDFYMLETLEKNNNELIMIVKPKEEHKEEVKNEIDNYFRELSDEIRFNSHVNVEDPIVDDYLPEDPFAEDNIIDNKLEMEYEGYYIYIVTEGGHNEMVYDYMINNIQYAE